MVSPEPTQAHRVLIFDADAQRAERLRAGLVAGGMDVSVCPDGSTLLSAVHNESPHLVIVDLDVPPKGGMALARTLKNDNAFAHLPVLIVVAESGLPRMEISGECLFDDYISPDSSPRDLLARALFCIHRARRHLDASPLTRLPGNNSIMTELETRIARKEEFATIHVDLSNFKAFNDHYGFTRGDEALRLTARLLVSCVSALSPQDYYIGHVGGDDFIFIVPCGRTEAICEEFIRNFDQIIGSVYDEEDRRRGYIQGVNRRGETETFPQMTVSLAVVVNRGAQFEHPGEISAIAAEVKKKLKQVPESAFLVDRREKRSRK